MDRGIIAIPARRLDPTSNRPIQYSLFSLFMFDLHCNPCFFMAGSIDPTLIPLEAMSYMKQDSGLGAKTGRRRG